jgi:hypothetical protein
VISFHCLIEGFDTPVFVSVAEEHGQFIGRERLQIADGENLGKAFPERLYLGLSARADDGIDDGLDVCFDIFRGNRDITSAGLSERISIQIPKRCWYVLTLSSMSYPGIVKSRAKSSMLGDSVAFMSRVDYGNNVRQKRSSLKSRLYLLISFRHITKLAQRVCQIHVYQLQMYS